MRNRLILFGLVFLVLISSGYAASLNSTCSTDSTLYDYVNETSHTYAATKTIDDFTDLLTTRGEEVTIFIVNFTSSSYVSDSLPNICYGQNVCAGGDISGIWYSNQGGSGKWGFEDTDGLDNMIGQSVPMAYNFTVTYNKDLSVYNYSVSANNGTFHSRINQGVMANIDIELLELESAGETNKYDAIYIWNGTDCPSDAPPPPAADNSLNITIPLPVNLSSFNVNTVNFNLTASSSYGFNCSIYINGTVNQTTDNWSSGEDVEVKFNVSFSEDGSHDYQFRCFDETIHANTSIFDFFMDFEVPKIQTNYINNSIFFVGNLSTQFNITDNILLHSLNVSIDDKVIFNDTHVHETTYQYNLSWDVHNMSVGIHNITVRVADGHTAFVLIDDYDWSNGIWNDYMKYKFVEGGYIKTELKDSSIFDEWTTTRLPDRYTQTLIPNNPSDTITLVEESSHKIHIADSPGNYKGQWIIFGDHWKDYVLKDEPESVVSIKRINDHKVEVTISGIKNQDRLEFESIGDLNTVERIYPFVVINSTATFTSPILELQAQSMSLVLNKTDNVSTNAELFYNDTEITVTKSTGSISDTYTSETFNSLSISTVQENVTFFWQYALTGLGNNESGNLTFNQTVNAIQFDNCSSFTTVAINMTVKNETTGLAIIENSTTIKGYFKVWKSAEADFVEFNLTWGPRITNSNFGLCIDPGTDNFTMDAQLEYDNDFFEKKLYYFNDYFIDNVTDFLDLFLTEGTTQVTLTVKDFDDSVVPDAVIKILSYDLATDTSTTTEIVETDTNGEALVQLVLNTEWYVFIVEVDGVIKLQTAPTRITTTTKTLRIDLEDIKYFDRYDVTRGIVHSLTWTNATNLFTFTWSDPSGEVVDACLKVSRRSVNDESVLFDRCIVSTAGTITHDINETITDQTFVAVSYVKFGIGESYILNTLVQSFEQTFKKFGLTGIFVSLLLILTLICIGIWHPVVAVLLAIFGLIVVSILGVFSVSWGVLIGVIIMGGILIYRLTKN